MISAPAYLVALAGFALAAPVMAADHAHSTRTSAQEAKPKEKLICKRETAMGSNFSTKICRSAAEWKAEYERDRRGQQDQDKD